MSIYRFPNATPDSILQIYDLLDSLSPTGDQKFQREVISITAAHICAGVECIINSPPIAAQSNPVVIAQLKMLIDSLR